MKAIFFICLVASVASLASAFALPPASFNSSHPHLNRRQYGYDCPKWTKVHQMSLLPDTFVHTEVGTLKEWRGSVTQIMSASSIRAVQLHAMINANKVIILNTKASNDLGLIHPSVLLVEFVLNNQAKDSLPGRQIWQIKASRSDHCILQVPFSSVDVRRLRVWQPKM